MADAFPYFEICWFLSYRKRGFEYTVDQDNLYVAISNELAEELSRSLMKVGNKTLKKGKILDSCTILFKKLQTVSKESS